MLTMIHEIKVLKTGEGRYIPMMKSREYTVREKPYNAEPRWRVMNYIYFTDVSFEKDVYFNLFDHYDSDDGYVTEKGLFYKKESLLKDLEKAFQEALTINEFLDNFEVRSTLDADIVNEEELMTALHTDFCVKVRRHTALLEAI